MTSIAPARSQSLLSRSLSQSGGLFAIANDNIDDHAPTTVLLFAVQDGELAKINAVFNGQSSFDQDDHMQQALELAARDFPTNSKLFEKFREHVDISCKDSYNTILAWAASCGDVDVVTTLIKNARYTPTYHCMVAAARYGQTKTLRKILASGRVHAADGNCAGLAAAAEFGDMTNLRMFLHNPEVSLELCSSDVLCAAVRGNHPEVVELLLKQKTMDPTADKNRAIIRAAELERHRIIKLLLEDGRADPTDAVFHAGQNKTLIHEFMMDKRVRMHIRDFFSHETGSALVRSMSQLNLSFQGHEDEIKKMEEKLLRRNRMMQRDVYCK